MSTKGSDLSGEMNILELCAVNAVVVTFINSAVTHLTLCLEAAQLLRSKDALPEEIGKYLLESSEATLKLTSASFLTKITESIKEQKQDTPTGQKEMDLPTH